MCFVCVQQCLVQGLLARIVAYEGEMKCFCIHFCVSVPYF